MLIYREDQNDKNTARRRIAELLIAKQRSGPTGDIPL
jgi:replicative DNA helicase